MRRTGLALLLTAATAAAGCGGGGGGSSTSATAGGTSSKTSSTSPAQFRSQVSQLCTQAQQKIDSVPKPKTATAIVPFINKTMAVAKPYVDKLAAINPPSNFAGQYKQIVSLNRQELALLSQTKSALSGSGNPVQVIRKFQTQANKLSSSEDAKWRQIGVPKCAS
ncbi:MAG TPA: hypothetical protein VJU60_07275 [Thermoleophilaceae bacterium]|nr:hypothetical protein [Thermoleophilaceae bacterium]